MYRGKIATFMATLSFIFVFFIGFSVVHDDGVTGSLVNFISTLFNFEAKHETIEVVAKSVGIFDLYEENIRTILRYLAIFFATLAGVIAVFASKYETNSLWYSVAIFIAISTFSEINYTIAGTFGVICLLLIMYQRKWKLSKA